MADTEVNPTGLFLWARSGGGHRTAKEGIKEQKIAEYAAKGKTLDVSNDIDITGEKVLSAVKLPFIGGLGEIGVRSWDGAQKKGDLAFLERYASMGWIGEIIFYPIVYFRMKWLLQDLRVEPEFVVSTQAFCLNAIVHAMQAVNRQKAWNMKMHVYLTDMPSKKAIHFFPSIRKVTATTACRDMITLHAPKPTIKAHETEESFWQKHCGKITVVTDEKFPIRKAFLETKALKERLKKPVVDINIKLNHPSEADIISNGLSNKESSSFDDEKATIRIKNEDQLAFLMLGSQPTTKSVLDWLRKFVQEAQNKQDDQKRYFFLYCGQPHSDREENRLLIAVNEELKKLKLPPNVNIVPFTNQDADEIACLMARSDVSITRSGGATSMELLELDRSDLPKRPNKRVLIHSEAALLLTKSPEPKGFLDFVKKLLGIARSDKKLVRAQIKKMQAKEQYQALDPEALRKLAIERLLVRKGIVLWEGGNAKYLANKIGAHITNPEFATF